jgi:ribosome maturation factor RimP
LETRCVVFFSRRCAGMFGVSMTPTTTQRDPTPATAPATPSSALEPFLEPLYGVEEELRQLIEPVVEGERLELVQLQLVRSQHRDLLRLAIDRPGAGVTPGKGISMAELERVNRLLGDLLDVEDNARKLFRERWELEVGSPGVDRPLTKKSHFKDVIGQKVKARRRLEKKSIVGRLEAVEDDAITVEGERMGFSELQGVHVVFEFAKPEKPGRSGGAKGGAKGPVRDAAKNPGTHPLPSVASGTQPTTPDEPDDGADRDTKRTGRAARAKRHDQRTADEATAKSPKDQAPVSTTPNDSRRRDGSSEAAAPAPHSFGAKKNS